jgi:hypothetical protein
MTLVEFLRARLDEDERVAQAANVKQGDPDWWVSEVKMTGGRNFTVRSRRDNRPIARVERLDGDDGEPGAILDGAAAAAHIARHDPARVLAEVEAKRRIVEVAMEQWRPGDLFNGSQGASDIDCEPPWILRVLALPYADHPDYDTAWRPA